MKLICYPILYVDANEFVGVKQKEIYLEKIDLEGPVSQLDYVIRKKR